MKYLRDVQAHERVRVYYNLHRAVWSLQNLKGQVIAHLPEVFLENVSWIVRPAGRAKVLREGKKNVHAFGVGNYLGNVPLYGTDKVARYNPYQAGHFVDGKGDRLSSSEFAYFRQDRQVTTS